MSQQLNEPKRQESDNSGPGRKPVGRAKQIRSVTVDDYVWMAALEIWSGKASRLVERLLRKYVQTPSIIPSHNTAGPTKP